MRRHKKHHKKHHKKSTVSRAIQPDFILSCKCCLSVECPVEICAVCLLQERRKDKSKIRSKDPETPSVSQKKGKTVFFSEEEEESKLIRRNHLGTCKRCTYSYLSWFLLCLNSCLFQDKDDTSAETPKSRIKKPDSTPKLSSSKKKVRISVAITLLLQKERSYLSSSPGLNTSFSGQRQHRFCRENRRQEGGSG